MTTFQLSPAASLNLGQSQNGVLENGLNRILKKKKKTYQRTEENGGNLHFQQSPFPTIFFYHFREPSPF